MTQHQLDSYGSPTGWVLIAAGNIAAWLAPWLGWTVDHGSHVVTMGCALVGAGAAIHGGILHHKTYMLRLRSVEMAERRDEHERANRQPRGGA